MDESLSDEETNNFLSQIDFADVSPIPQYDAFDAETDLLLSQFDIDKFLKKEEAENLHIPETTNIGKDGPAETAASTRFTTVTTDDDVENVRKSSTPRNTVKNTMWGVKAWDNWGKWRNDKTLQTGLKNSTPYVLVPPLTVDLQAHEFNYWLCRFVIEVRKQDGQEYPAETLRQLCISVWRYLRDVCRRYDLNFLDRQKPEFADARECLDSRMKTLDQASDYKKRQAEPVSSSEENLLWTQVFDKNTALSLQFAVYFYNCKLFGLRAADEHANLTVEQFEVGTDQLGEYLRFLGGKAKNAQVGVFYKKINPKDIKQYADETNPRCVVRLFKLYLQYIPDSGPFYRRPLDKRGPESEPRYSTQKVGIHTIAKYMQQMCKEAGISGYKTGHSGKVTTATSLYNQGFDEQLIAGRTGHRSTAIRAYKRTSDQQLKAVSDALQPPRPSSSTLVPYPTTSTSTDCPNIEIERNGTKLTIKL